ncbi:plasmid pRiA4b ORF-3 family protein [Nonomuraea sp. K274]|uniref:Plasmid pRiA4b ORF-3 family protein n=1 Tax=Nonomuraea cypriaca TaxID=1187855 RepID=A0A931AIT7_9ACTN|nr:plasmid pRiA4b ORF-3 family protein [Nonomuraea cypriaca]MBF8192480.1 plasmid pRiA4b ORF-3 family protein [Nonomuraea cypriaca]
MSSIAETSVFVAAHALASWAGAGRAVTPSAAIKPALVPDAAAVLGVVCPAKVRRLSDVPEVQRAWLTAVAAGLVTIEGSRAVRAEPAPTLGPDAWYAALEQVIAVQIGDPCEADPRICCLVTLNLLAEEAPPLGQALREAAEQEMRQRGDWDWRVYRLIDGHPVDRLLPILVAFGALDDRLMVTELGEHARKEVGKRLPLPITPDLSAAEVLARIATAPPEEVPELLWRWRIENYVPGSRTVVDRLPELLRATTEASPAGRLSVIEVVAERGDAEALWQAVCDLPPLGPHARWWLNAEIEGDRQWRAVDYALAALDRHGATDARYVLLDMMGGDLHEGVRGSGHPEADRLLAALPPTSPAIPAYQLKISVAGAWHRVLVPENYSLGDLHQIIRKLFGWSDDHLHVFRVGKRRYSDPFRPLEECGDEDLCRLNRALPAPRSALRYTYDLGDCWEHEILLEKILTEEIAVPICVDGHGDNPIEDYNPDYPEEPVPFDRDAINERLARLVPVDGDDQDEVTG